jgi:hypothetical protein
MAKKRSAASAVEAIHWPLPAGQNPGDPFYGGLDPSNPSDYAVISGKLDSAARITDAAERVLHWADRILRWHADQIAKATKEGSSKEEYLATAAFVERSRDQLADAVAALDAVSVPAEARQAIDTEIHAAFTIGRMLGNLEQALSARKGMPRAHADRVQTGRKRKAEARRALEPEIIKDKKWSFKQDDLPGKLQGELIERTGKRWSLTTIRRDIDFHRATTR